MTTRGATARLGLFVRGTYWLGAILDALAGIRMLLADRITGEGVAPGAGFPYAMWSAAALMFSWSGLLVWAQQDPIQRRGVLALTACPALLGLIVAQGVAVNTGFRTPRGAMPFWILEAVLFVIFLAAYVVARRVAAAGVPSLGGGSRGEG